MWASGGNGNSSGSTSGGRRTVGAPAPAPVWHPSSSAPAADQHDVSAGVPGADSIPGAEGGGDPDSWRANGGGLGYLSTGPHGPGGNARVRHTSSPHGPPPAPNALGGASGTGGGGGVDQWWTSRRGGAQLNQLSAGPAERRRCTPPSGNSVCSLIPASVESTAFAGRDRPSAPSVKVPPGVAAVPPSKGDPLHTLQGARLHSLPMRARIQGRGY